MKFTQKTVQILKNFASINTAIHFKKGDYLSTASQGVTIVAKAKIDQTFEHDFAIFDLNRFLGALSLFNDPEIKFYDRYLVIKGQDRELNYTFTDPNTIVTPPKGLALPSVAANLKLPANILADIIKALSVMGLPEVAFVGDGEGISVHAIDTKDPTSNQFKISNLGKTDKTFRAVYRVENLKVIPMDYEVTIAPKGISHWVGDGIEYYIGIEKSSQMQ